MYFGIDEVQEFLECSESDHPISRYGISSKGQSSMGRAMPA